MMILCRPSGAFLVCLLRVTIDLSPLWGSGLWSLQKRNTICLYYYLLRLFEIYLTQLILFTALKY
jgi:hypothetical protein